MKRLFLFAPLLLLVACNSNQTKSFVQNTSITTFVINNPEENAICRRAFESAVWGMPIGRLTLCDRFFFVMREQSITMSYIGPNRPIGNFKSLHPMHHHGMCILPLIPRKVP